MRTKRYSIFLLAAVLGCSLVLTSCEAITAQKITKTDSGLRMNGFPGVNGGTDRGGGGQGIKGGGPGRSGSQGTDGGQGGRQ
ncbi:hypothetical protein H70357_03910 [Paenibacillus sp. FSL H7-0357]|jgi:hypothetical protein|uniref:hypothetical protein n=1 Tax=unclassified Paenibacillus TaxID=185978 RepID=UPI0004F6137E|nr:hypothetical protein [Paenibacillus sp. FSL H7-0357]AIQ15932.1 hypothetical protein H70357_03910 [Paenibacillus sp. FSL H7-0357]